MNNPHVGPLALQVLDDQPPVTVLGGRFATEQHTWRFKIAWGELAFDVSFFHQLEELGFVHAPVSFVFLVGIQNVLRGCQQRLVHVLGVAQFAQEIGQVIAFGKGGQLRDVVQPHVD
jgi:hypothetical protein